MTQHTQTQEPTNIQRAQWAKAALTVFTEETFGGDHPDAMTPGDLEDAITDLICDLVHFHPRIAAATVHARALDHFQHEVTGEEACDCAARSWYGPYHDTQCPVSTRRPESVTPDAAGQMLAALKFALPFMEDLANSGHNKGERRAAKLMREAIREAQEGEP